MRVIFYAADNQRFAIMFTQHLGEICMHFATQQFVV